MAKTFIPGGDAVFIADKADTTYILKAGTSLSVMADSAIDAHDAAANRTFLLNGSISGANIGITAGSYFSQPENLDVRVGANAYISALNAGVSVYSKNGSITNAGTISANGNESRAINFYGTDGTIENSGSLSAYYGVSVIGDDNSVVNSGTINATYKGVFFNTSSGDENSLNNSGVIKAVHPGFATFGVSGDGGNEHITNSGRIVGDIFLQDGNDTFTSKGGTVKGEIIGGAGSDTYRIDSSAFVITEEADQSGIDRVYTSASYTVAAGIEQTTLTGKADINLTGTIDSDVLNGNRGDNRIVGGVGLDYITGGAGNDRLTGGPGGGVLDTVDIFFFKAHSGHDVVNDFQDGIDRLNLANYKGIEGFDDLDGHIKQVNDETVVISLLDGDTIRLKNMDLADINAADFQF